MAHRTADVQFSILSQRQFDNRIFDITFNISLSVRDCKQQTCRPTVIECIIEMEDLVLPAIKSGDALQDMIVEVSKK